MASLSWARAAQAALQLRDRGRQDENAHHVLGRGAAELLGPLPVDVEQDVAAGCQGGLDCAARGAVGMTVDPGMLQELAAGDHGGEALLADEVIVDAVGLGRAARSGGDGDGERDLGLLLEQAAGERGLAGPGWRGDHQHEPAAAHRVRHRVTEQRHHPSPSRPERKAFIARCRNPTNRERPATS